MSDEYGNVIRWMTCSVCGKEKPSTMFAQDWNGHRRTRCKSCDDLIRIRARRGIGTGESDAGSVRDRGR